MAGIFGSPKVPSITSAPPAPSLADEPVQREAADAMKNRKGRASTQLTDPHAQRDAEASRQSYLTGA